MSYDTESKSRNADFISIARRAIRNPQRRRRCRPLSESEHKPFDTTRGVSRTPFFIICGGAATTTLGAKGPVKLKNPPAHRAGQS
jgi:hypothetical protein